jgi:23S rRNA (adenine2503-C2)-methyltransferase
MLAQMGQPKFRAAQLFKWLQSGVTDFDSMSNLPSSLREALKSTCYIADVKIVRRLQSQIDGTVKYVYELFDGEYIESVLMKYEHGYTVCISTQVGCRMGCSFCASGLNGLCRNLTASEMLAQITAAQLDNGIRISNIVMMGMGEPLDNFENSIRFLQLVSDNNGLNIGLRHISLSTCGLVDKIDMLSSEGLPITLSVSLHAYDNEVRSSIMPINNKYPIEELLSACSRYFDKTGRRISFEYTLIAGKNDTEEGATALAKILKKNFGSICHVNLIPLNEVKETMLEGSKNANKFKNKLISLGINATIRRRLGSDINASCGQLRRASAKGEVSE